MCEITPQAVKKKLDRGEDVYLLDVREAEELTICRLSGAEHIPMLQLFADLKRPGADPDREIVVFCHVGNRSLEAASFLRRKGFPRVHSMAGGIDAWAATVDPSMPRY